MGYYLCHLPSGYSAKMGGSISAIYQVGTLQRWGVVFVTSTKWVLCKDGGFICAIYQVGTLQRWGVVFVPSTKWVPCKDGG